MTTTGEPITRLPFADWNDDLAWMEPMRGPRWRRALAAEQHTLTIIQNLPPVRRAAAEARDILIKAGKEADQFNEMVRLPRNIPPAIRDEDNDFDICAIGTAVLVPRTKGSGFVSLAFFETGARTPTWQRKNVGGTVAIRDGRIYYTRADQATGRTYALESAAVLTGGDVQTLFENKDQEATIELIKGEAGTLWFQIDRSGQTVLYHLEIGGAAAGGAKATLLDDESYSQIPLGMMADGEAVWIATEADGKQAVRTAGAASKRQMPHLPADGFFIHAGSAAGRWLLGHLHGCDRLYMALECDFAYKKIYEVVGGEITYEAAALATCPATQPPPFLIESIEAAPQRLVIADGIAHTHSLVRHLPAYTISQGHTTSRDGSHVHFLIARKGSSTAKPVGLLVYGYGSYGSSTPICRARTKFSPLLEKGWAVAFAFIRGGGDRGEAWSSAGRFVNREHSLEDFEAVILATRGRLGVPADRTVITGRSAGGALMGAMVARHLEGGLFKGVFAEVPFVDGLRTMSNLKYPYTPPEFGEYGNPAASLTEFMTVFGISATNRLPVCGAPAIFVLARAAENDSQVLAYEPLKWIWRLRGEGAEDGEGKLFAFGKDQGHFYDEDADIKARSYDLAILHTWITQPIVRQKISAMSIKMANNVRKNNRNTRKNNAMKGGKKRSTTRKASRKGRKATRKARKH